MCHSVPVDVFGHIMVDAPARPRVLLKVVPMRYAKLKIPSWRMGILKAIQAIPVAQIRDALFLVLVLLGLIVLLISPIFFSLLMPTGS